MAGFRDELEKIALPLGGLASAARRGAAAVARQGAGGAVRAVARKGLQSAGSGARDAGGLVARFGKRQVHGLTGWTPKAGIQSIRGGAYETGERLQRAKAAVGVKAPAAKAGTVDKVLRRSPEKIQQRAAKAGHSEVAAARKAHEAGQKAEDMGLTSLPGYAKSLKRHGVGKTVGAGFAEQWHGVGPVGKGLMALPAIPVASELARKSKPGEDGRFARAGSHLGEFAYTMGPVPIAAQIAGASALGSVGKRIGALADRKRTTKNNPAPPSLEPAGGEAVVGEPAVSDRAMGTVQ